MYKIVEKNNHLAVHGIFGSKDKANEFIKETIPNYVNRGYYMDKTLTKDSFMVIESK